MSDSVSDDAGASSRLPESITRIGVSQGHQQPASPRRALVSCLLVADHYPRTLPSVLCQLELLHVLSNFSLLHLASPVQPVSAICHFVAPSSQLSHCGVTSCTASLSAFVKPPLLAVPYWCVCCSIWSTRLQAHDLVSPSANTVSPSQKHFESSHQFPTTNEDQSPLRRFVKLPEDDVQSPICCVTQAPTSTPIQHRSPAILPLPGLSHAEQPWET